MGSIKLESGEVIPERRVNGARIKLDVADWVKISITIFTTFAIITFGAGKYISILNGHTEVLAEQKAQIKINTARLDKTEVDITNIKENLIYIRGKVDMLVLKIK